MSKEDISLFDNFWVASDDVDGGQGNYRISGRVVSVGYKKGCVKGGISIDLSAGQGRYARFFFNRSPAFPLHGRHIVITKIKVSDISEKEFGKKKRRLFINASFGQVEDTDFIYYEPGAQFIRRYALKEYPTMKKPLVNPLRILLVVPEKGRQGETDFLRILHPSSWESITKFRVNMVNAKSIVKAADKITAAYVNSNEKDINCVCFIRGGGSGIEVFSDNSVIKAFQKMKKAFGNAVFLLAGIGHSNDCIGCSEVFDVSAFTPSHAAMFINAQLNL